ncbi:MAG: YHS domain-containing protein [Pseudomonadota bacterium]
MAAEINGEAERRVMDPVCGMTVTAGHSAGPSRHGGRDYWFCCPGCQKSFERDPARFLRPVTIRPKGWFGRWLDRMGRANAQAFGQAGPRCH